MRHLNTSGRRLAQKYFLAHLIAEESGIRFIPDCPADFDIPIALHELLMLYAVAVENKILFAKCAADDHKPSAYMPACGFGAVRALLEAAHLFQVPEYQKKARDYAAQLLKQLYTRGIKCEQNMEIRLCCLDLKALRMLSDIDQDYAQMFNHVCGLVRNGYVSYAFPLFSSFYNPKFTLYKVDPVETVQSLITAVHLAELNLCPPETISFIKTMVQQETLYSAYSIFGKPIGTDRSVVLYALASVLGKTAGDEELQHTALTKMLRFQVTDKSSPFYGAFVDPETGIAYPFQNLYALLALANAPQA